jgi:hypothetical protein
VPIRPRYSVGGVEFGDDVAGAHDALVIDRERAHAATDLGLHVVELLHNLDDADDTAVLDDVALGDERRRLRVRTAVEDAGDRGSNDVLIAISAVNSSMRNSVSAGSAVGPREAAMMAPQSFPSTTIGAPTKQSNPNSRASSATGPLACA